MTGFEIRFPKIPKEPEIENCSCYKCGGDFNDEDLKTENYTLEFGDDSWDAKHKDCSLNFEEEKE
jgi:hypothetical protein